MVLGLKEENLFGKMKILFYAAVMMGSAFIVAPSAQAAINPALIGFIHIYDLNSDNKVNATDIDLLSLKFNTHLDRFDFNGDGNVDRTDMDILIKGVLQVNYGDADLDGDVDASDLSSLRSHLGLLGQGWAAGDSDGDGDVDATDLAAIRSNLGKPAPVFSFAPYIPLEFRPPAVEPPAHLPSPTAFPWAIMGLAAVKRPRRRD